MLFPAPIKLLARKLFSRLWDQKKKVSVKRAYAWVSQSQPNEETRYDIQSNRNKWKRKTHPNPVQLS